MGCFTACFRSSRHSKTKSPSEIALIKDQNLCHDHEINGDLKRIELLPEARNADPANFNAEIINKDEEQLNSSVTKKVTFYLNVKAYKEGQIQEEANNLVESEEGKEGGKSEESKHEFQALLCSSRKEEEEKMKREKGKDVAVVISDSSVSSLFSYPPNNRYQNCISSDDESDVMASNGRNVADESDSKNDVGKDQKNKDGCEGLALVQEESSESLFSLSIDSKKQLSAAEIGEKEVSSPLKPHGKETKNQNATHRNQFMDSVLNPIENLGQWKAVSAKSLSSLKHQEKGNINSEQGFTIPIRGRENHSLELEFSMPFSEKPTFKKSLKSSRQISERPKDNSITVDTSLSSWLIESEKTRANENSPGSGGNSTSKKTMSPKSFDDRPVLGALTVDQLKQMPTPSPPRRSPSYGPDEKPIIGTVGSYWMHIGQAKDANAGSSCLGASGALRMSGQCRTGTPNSESTTPVHTR